MSLNIQKFFKCLCIKIMSKKPDNNNKAESHSDRRLDDSSEEEGPDTTLKTTEEERRGTIPGSTCATASALAGARAQANPTVERGPPRRRKKNKNKKDTDTVGTQTPKGQ